MFLCTVHMPVISIITLQEKVNQFFPLSVRFECCAGKDKEITTTINDFPKLQLCLELTSDLYVIADKSMDVLCVAPQQACLLLVESPQTDCLGCSSANNLTLGCRLQIFKLAYVD